jgi:aminotransferase
MPARSFVSKKAACFAESVIREMTRLAARHDAINLAQGFPDFPAPEPLKEAACAAIRGDVNQYAITWGAKSLRDALAAKYRRDNGMEADPETMLTVCCGATEAMISALMAVVNPGDEVVIFEPYYENYGPDAILSGATPRFVPLHEPDWHFDERELAAAFNDRTKAIVINPPNNPTGKVFTRADLEFIGSLCRKWDALAVTDEPYEYILFDGRKHVSIGSLDGMRDRTITVSALSKTFSITGWRLGWAVAPPAITGAVRKVHDFLTVGAPHPLQEAAARVLPLAEPILRDLSREYQERRDVFLAGLREAGMDSARSPEGAYYIMVDIAKYGRGDDSEFARWLVREIGVAGVPGSSFYSNPKDGRTKLRLCFPKKLETLREACRRLRQLS